MHPALKKTVLVAIVFAALLVGLPLAGSFILKSVRSLGKSPSSVAESESERGSVLDEETHKYTTLSEVNKEGVSILPVQELLETKIPYTSRETALLAINSPLLINEPAPYGTAGVQFLSSDEDREKFINLVVVYSAYNFGEEVHVREIEFRDLLYYDSVVLQYQAVINLTDAQNNSASLLLTVGHNLDEAIFYITTERPEYFDYEQNPEETETEWEDANA